MKKQPKQQNAREIFSKWCFLDNKNGKKYLFEIFYSDDVFVARRVPNGYTCIWTYKTKK